MDSNPNTNADGTAPFGRQNSQTPSRAEQYSVDEPLETVPAADLSVYGDNNHQNNHNNDDDNGDDNAGEKSEKEEKEDEDFRQQLTCKNPTAAKWFAAVPCLAYFPLFGKVCGTYGPRLTLSLGACYIMVKGAAGSMIHLSMQPMFIKHYKVDVQRLQQLSCMYTLGWSVKAVIAVLTDTFACFGYTKRWYMAFSALFGAAFALAYALLPGKPGSANAAAAFIFLTCFSKANIDILSEGHFSRKVRQEPKAGPSLVSWVWACTYVGVLISACVMGPLADANFTYAGIIISAGLEFLTIFFFIFNLYGEKKNRTERRKDALLEYRARVRAITAAPSASPSPKKKTGVVSATAVQEEDEGRQEGGREALVDEVPNVRYEDSAAPEPEPFVEPVPTTCLCGAFEINKHVVTRNWRLVAYSVLLTCGSITLAVVSVLGTTWQLIWACIAVLGAFIIGAFLAMPVTTAKVALFILLKSVVYIQVPSALSTFYMATPRCAPDGPHFSYTFYQTVGVLITNACGMLGAFLFNSLFARNRYYYIFCVTTIFMMVGSIFDLILLRRWNLYIGIPDHAMYLFGDAVLYEVSFVLSMVPAQILMARLCPRGTESISFAIVDGLSSAGISMSVAIGSILMKTIWKVSTSVVPCQFENLQYIVITGHLVTPILIIPLAFLLLPNSRLGEPLKIDKELLLTKICRKLRGGAPPAQEI